MFLETFPPTQPVALSGISALVNHAGFAVPQLDIGTILWVAVINFSHVLPFHTLQKTKKGYPKGKPLLLFSFGFAFYSALFNLRLQALFPLRFRLPLLARLHAV